MATQPTVELNRRPEARASAHGVTELVVTGMTCSHCAQRVTGAIQSVAGVHSATVSLEARQALARWEPQASPDVGKHESMGPRLYFSTFAFELRVFADAIPELVPLAGRSGSAPGLRPHTPFLRLTGQAQPT